MIIPRSLPDYLRAACPLYAAENFETQLRVAHLLWLCRDARRAHREFEGFASISKEDLREVFGSDATARRILAGKYFIVFRGNSLSNYTAAFQPAENLLAAMEECVRDPGLVDLVDQEGRVLAPQRGAVAPRRAGTGTRSEWRDAVPERHVPVDVDAMLTLQPFCAPLLAQATAALVRLARNRRKPGTIPHRYHQYTSGRLFAEPPSLQSAPRPVRAAALHGCWDHDIENCHFAIFSHLAHQAGERTPCVDEYLAGKKELRDRIAREVGIELADAKACLIMIVYGAKLRLRMKTGPAADDWQLLAIAKEIGEPAARRLFRCPTYVNLQQEVERTRVAIINAHTLPGGLVTNRMNVTVNPNALIPAKKKFTEAKLLAHILQGYEAAALREIVRTYGDRILLCMHDGWVTQERLDVEACEALLRRATGIPLRIEQRRLVHPMDVGPVRQVGNREKSVSDQGLAEAEITSYAAKSPLLGCPVEKVESLPDRSGLVLSLRAKWNYLPDVD